MKNVEYKVRPVTRWIITKFESEGSLGCSCVIGEFENLAHANQTAQCLYDAHPKDNETRVSVEI